MNAEPLRPDPRGGPAPTGRRLFLHEPGWQIALKQGSAREFCYMTAPGQDYYHRLLDREVYLYNGEERLCLACAERRGLLSYEPRGLRPALGFAPAFDPDFGPDPFELDDTPGRE